MKNFNQDRDRGFSRDSGSRRDFNKDTRRGGFDGRSGGRSNDRGGGRSGGVTMHKAVCSECGVDCEVPFRPTGGKPVFCSSCFENKNRSEDRFESRESSRHRFNDNKFSSNKFSDNKKSLSDAKLDEVISRLDKIVRLLTPVINLKESNSVEVKKDTLVEGKSKNNNKEKVKKTENKVKKDNKKEVKKVEKKAKKIKSVAKKAPKSSIKKKK